MDEIVFLLRFTWNSLSEEDKSRKVAKPNLDLDKEFDNKIYLI